MQVVFPYRYNWNKGTMRFTAVVYLDNGSVCPVYYVPSTGAMYRKDTEAAVTDEAIAFAVLQAFIGERDG